jgi:hypothetical protein
VFSSCTPVALFKPQKHLEIRAALIYHERLTEDDACQGRLESVSEVIGMLASSIIGML